MKDENGQVLVFVVLVVSSLIILGGLVIDGGALLAAQRRAINVAEGAARVGADQLAEEEYRLGVRKINQVQAEQEVADYVSSSNSQLDEPNAIEFPTDDSVRVRVTFERPTFILAMIGINDFTVKGEGEALAVQQ